MLLLPGALVLRALAWPSPPAVALAASFALSLAVVTLSLALVFAVGSSILLAAAVILAVSVGAALLAILRSRGKPASSSQRRPLLVAVGMAIPYAGVVWWSAGAVRGDGPFHLARARKLAELDSLSALTTVSEFKDGGLHPGYAFPLWHGVDALVARIAGVDVGDAFVFLPAILVPLAFTLAFGAGSAVFRSHVAGLVFVGAQVAFFGLYWGTGAMAGTGFFETTSQPQAASLLLLTPAIVVLLLAFSAEGRWIFLVCFAAAGLSLTLVHPTYTAYVALVGAGFVLARVILVRGWDIFLTRATLALGVLLASLGCYFVVLLSLLAGADAWTPGAARADAIVRFGNAFTTVGDWVILSPDAIARAGAVVVAGLLAVPLAGFAARRLWAAFVLGGSLAVLVVLLTPPLFTTLADAFSISQARRLAQFLPIAYSVTGACVVLSRLRGPGVALAGGVGTVLVLVYPGEFTYVYGEGGPSWAVAVALLGGLAALVFGALTRPSGVDPSRWTAVIGVAFLLPVAVAGLAGLEGSRPRTTLTDGAVEALRSEISPGDVVFSDKRTAYVLAGFAPVYVNASAAGHVARTEKNRLRTRGEDTGRFFHAESLAHARRAAILEKYGAEWVFIDKRNRHPVEFLLTLRRVYEDRRYALYSVHP